MQGIIPAVFKDEGPSRWLLYAIKALALVGLLYLLAQIAPSMPPVAIAVAWALLSILSAVALTYHVVMRRVLRRQMFTDASHASAFIGRRALCLVAMFIASALMIGGLVFEMPKWGPPEWIFLAIASALFAILAVAVGNLLDGEVKPTYLVSKTVLISGVIVGALLCGMYLLMLFLEPPSPFANATQAFLSVPLPFEDSPSPLMAELGKLVAVADGLSAYALSKVAEGSAVAAIACKVAVSASAFFGVASLLGACFLRARELKLVFLPLDAAEHLEMDYVPLWGVVVAACLVPVVLAGAFMYADMKAGEALQTQEYTAIETFVRDQVGLAVYVLDGAYYDEARAAGAIERAHEASLELAAERQEVLTPLINEVFDARLANVDAFLDWYYSLPADYERLAQWFTGTVEDGMREQLEQRINEGVDDSALSEKMDYYLGKSGELRDNLLAELEQYQVDNVPRWLMVEHEAEGADFLDDVLAPSQSFLSAGERLGISAGAGIAAGLIAKKVVERMVSKAFFQKIVASLLEKLALRGLLAAGGTVLAPGVGTVVGIGAGVATDALLLKADEALNREEYREEIVSAIEESRQEMLSAAEASG